MSAPFAHLTQSLILDASEAFGLEPNSSLYPLNSYENRVYYVGIEQNTPVVCKIYRPDRWSAEQIKEELNFIEELAADEQAVIAPLMSNDDNRLSQLFDYAGFHFAFWPLKSGHPIELANPEQLYLVGQKLGRLHYKGQNRLFEYRPTLHLYDSVNQCCQDLLNSAFLPNELKADFANLCSDIIDCFQTIQPLYDQCKKIRVHGDLHAGNILIRDQEVFIVDFDDSINAPAICDIWMLLSGNQQEQKLQQPFL